MNIHFFYCEMLLNNMKSIEKMGTFYKGSIEQKFCQSFDTAYSSLISRKFIFFEIAKK